MVLLSPQPYWRTVIEVVVLEKHTDFLRDFRGDTLHRFDA
jgi:hypothetical protein